MARSIHGEIEISLEFQETGFLGGRDEAGVEEGGEEDGGVGAVHVVEVEFYLFGRVLGCAGEVDCGVFLC